MTIPPQTLALSLLLATTAALAAPVTDAPFFDPLLPVHGTPVEVAADQWVPRGLLIRVAAEEWVVFDQELLRPALWLQGEAGKDPLTLETMAQRSWHEPTRKAGAKLSIPTGDSRLLAPALPGVGARVEDLLRDPRPEVAGEAGRGSLAGSGRKLTGYRLAGETAVLAYTAGKMAIEEWYQPSAAGLERQLRIAPGEAVCFLLGSGRLAGKGAALGDGAVQIAPPVGAVLEEQGGQIIARIAPARSERRLVVEYRFTKKAGRTGLAQQPGAPVARWAGTVQSGIQEAERKGPGWVLDRIALPEQNPWKRRVRPADIVFKNEREAYLVTFDGDVWSMALSGKKVAWRRFAGGLSEPLSLELVSGVPQVFTRNGVIRLHDRNNDGEADFYQIHSDGMMQPASTRAYPLDMEVDDAGRTWCSFGGIAMKGNALSNTASSNPYAGAIVEISPDGSAVKIIASRAREPFFAWDPAASRMAMSDQQGHYVPASGLFPVVPGANFGYGSEQLPNLALPSVWIPHEADTSSASPLWVRGSAFKEWEGGLLNLSYGTGRLFLVRPSGAWPSPRGAAIPLEIETGVPVLHGRVQPGEGSLWLAGFRVYDSRVPDLQGLARLRPGPGALAAPVDAAVVTDGVVLRFAAALQAASVTPEKVRVRSWQYQRSKAYGSPRLMRSGGVGTDGVASGETILSQDGRSVFIHLPGLAETMQLEVEYDFQLADGTPTKGPAYFTARKLEPMHWVERGFAAHTPDAARAVIRVSPGLQGPATAEAGKEIVTRLGCVACHSSDGTTLGHSGPSWKGLYGAMRTMSDGSRVKADDAYLKEAIFEPAARVVQGYQAAMGSYSGVLSEVELESVLLYLRTL